MGESMIIKDCTFIGEPPEGNKTWQEYLEHALWTGVLCGLTIAVTSQKEEPCPIRYKHKEYGYNLISEDGQKTWRLERIGP